MPYKDRGKWRGVIKINGKRVRQQSFRLKKDAATWERDEGKKLRMREKRLQGGLDLLTFCSKYLIFSDRYVKKVFDEKKNTCERILKYWGKDTLVEDISVDMAESYLLEQKLARSANASNKDRKNLHAMWEKGFKTWGVPRNIFSDTEKFSHDRQPQFTPSPEQVNQVLLVATRKESVFLYCYLFTGARRSELFRWTWIDDINIDKRLFRKGTRKNRDGSMRYKWFRMPGKLYDELRWWWDNRPIKNSPYVFTDDQPGPHYGKPYKARRRFMPGLCKRAFDPGCKNVETYISEKRGPLFGFHALRRYFASRLADAGKSTKSIGGWLMHENVHTTEIYLQDIADDSKAITDALTEEILLSVPQAGTPEKEKDAGESR